VEGFDPVAEYVEYTLPTATVRLDGASGEILVLDDFGNAITNIPGDCLSGRFGNTIEVNGQSAPVRHTYAAVEPGAHLVTVGSHGNVELAVNQSRGADAFAVEAGTAVELAW
jgi:S-adenosylmethionine hydrolase